MKYNIVLIITDCLRYDYFIKFMNIKKYAMKILHKVYSPAPNTFFAIPSIMTGTLPFQIIKDAKINKSIYTYIPLLARVFEYETIYITTNIVTSRYFGYYTPSSLYMDFLDINKVKIWNRIMTSKPSSKGKLSVIKSRIHNILRNYPYVYRLILKTFLLLRKQQLKMDINVNYDFKTRITDVINYLAQLQLNRMKSYFTFIHLMDTHAPYGAPSLSKKVLKTGLKVHQKLYYHPLLLRHKEIEILKELYMSEVEFLDKHLDTLLDLIFRKMGYDNTLVIMISDHGEAFGEKGIFTHPGHALIEELLHIPASLYGDATNSIVMDENALYSSIQFHEVITKVFAGYEQIVINPLKEVISIGYKRLSDEYKISGYAKISNHGIISWDLEKEQSNKSHSELMEKLKKLRREYLRGKLKNEVYGIRLVK